MDSRTEGVERKSTDPILERDVAKTNKTAYDLLVVFCVFCAVGTPLVFTLFCLLYQFTSNIFFPAPAWGGYCERKAWGSAVLEPINAWTSIVYVVFAGFSLAFMATYRVLFGLDKLDASLHGKEEINLEQLQRPQYKFPSAFWFGQFFLGYAKPVYSPKPNDSDQNLKDVFKISVADFDPAAISIVGNKGQIAVEVRWSIRTSIWPGIIYYGVGLVLGYGSWLFHARFDQESSLADFAGMMGLSAFAFAYMCARIHFGLCGRNEDVTQHLFGCIKSYRGIIFFVVFSLTYTFGFLLRVYLTTDPTIYLFISFLVLSIVMEIIFVFYNYYTNKYDPNLPGLAVSHFTLLLLAIGCFIVAVIVWELDKPYCNPDSAYQGHAFWHVLTAFAYYFLFCFYFSESSAVYRFYGDSPI